MTTDGFPRSFDSPNGPEGRFWSYEDLSEGVVKAHAKLLEAQMKDIAHVDAGVEGSYRYVQQGRVTGEGIVDRHLKLTLVPVYGATEQADFERVNLAIPIKNWEIAGGKLQEAHRMNLLLHESSDLKAPMPGEPRYVPTYDIFGKAIRSDGTEMRFLLTTTSLAAYRYDTEIVPAGLASSLDGQYYAVTDSPSTARLQTEMLGFWFNEAQLKDVLTAYEPVPTTEVTS